MRNVTPLNPDRPKTKLKTVPWLAELLDLSTKQTYEAIAQRQIPQSCVVRIGRRIRISEEAVSAWLSAERAQENVH